MRYRLALSQLAVRTEHIHNLVDVHLLHVLTSGLQILTRIEVSRMLSEVLADSSSHSQTRVRVDVNLADSTLRSLTQLLFGNTDSCLQMATELVDGVHLVHGERWGSRGASSQSRAGCRMPREVERVHRSPMCTERE